MACYEVEGETWCVAVGTSGYVTKAFRGYQAQSKADHSAKMIDEAVSKYGIEDLPEEIQILILSAIEAENMPEGYEIFQMKSSTDIILPIYFIKDPAGDLSIDSYNDIESASYRARQSAGEP